MRSSKHGVKASQSMESLASADPWERFERGADLARSVKRGREQEALWLLDDGARPPPELLSRALGSAAHQGMERLCWRLIGMGASAEIPRAASSAVREKVLVCGPWSEERADRWPPAMLAMLAGHAELALRMSESCGEKALGARASSSKAYFALCSAKSLDGRARAMALEFARELMSARDRERSANALCIAGMVEDALDLLESADEAGQARVARAMAAPLCAYGPAEAGRERALVALRRAVELCGGRAGPALAPWSFVDVSRLDRGRDDRNNESSRMEEVALLMSSSDDWPSAGVQRELACWPRVAAFHSQNFHALTILDGIKAKREELASLRWASGLSIAVLDKERPAEDMPSLWDRNWGGLQAPRACDPRAGAMAAMAFAEAAELDVSAIEGARRADKRRRREGEEWAAQGKPETGEGQPARSRRL